MSNNMAKIADARKTVEQLKLEVNIERMMVSLHIVEVYDKRLEIALNLNRYNFTNIKFQWLNSILSCIILNYAKINVSFKCGLN